MNAQTRFTPLWGYDTLRSIVRYTTKLTTRAVKGRMQNPVG